MNRRYLARSATALGLALVLGVPATAAATPTAQSTLFPTAIALPAGFQPEGIAIGALPYAYVGSLTDGSIYRANLVTGRGRVITPGPGTPSVGLDLDRRGRLFVSGGGAGDARVVSAATGRVLASYQLTDAESTFVNDVIVTPAAAWFTDSFNPVLYRVPLGRHGALPDQVETVPLGGDYQQGEGFSGNGISRTPDGTGLLLAQSDTGLLFNVNPTTGVATTVDLGGETLPGPDGLLLRGRLLYVVGGGQVNVVRLDRSGATGAIVATATDPRFETPTTAASFAGRLYIPDARFGTEPTPDTEYQVVAIPIPR